MNNKPTQNSSKRTIAKLIASAVLTVFAVAMPMAASAATTGSQGTLTTSVSWGGCSACGK